MAGGVTPQPSPVDCKHSLKQDRTYEVKEPLPDRRQIDYLKYLPFPVECLVAVAVAKVAVEKENRYQIRG